MTPSFRSLGQPSRRRRSARCLTFLLVAGVPLGFLGWASGLLAGAIPSNLGNGLGKLVESHLAVKAAQERGIPLAHAVSVNHLAYEDAQAANYAALSITDDSGRVLVRVNPTGEIKLKTLRKTLKSAIGSLGVTASDKTYQNSVGVFNAFVSIDDVPALATAPGVRSVILEIKPRTRGRLADALLSDRGPKATVGETLNKLGTAFDQGVTQHRVDQINQFYNPSAASDYEGAGLTIGCMSDSFNDLTTAGRTAAAGVANFDLPGNSSNPVNTQPVVVLEDYAFAGTDEGRAMCEIAYKMAPKARIGFATAFYGTVDFANNIRALAGIAGYTYPSSVQQGFAADTICDDVSYEDEPFFQDGIIARGVDDASAAGVCYFSSAGNELGINSYASDFRYVPNGTGLTAAAGNTALAGTNINLANVPTNLYAGGFHNFNPAAGQQDVAQTLNVPAGNTNPLAFEWDDPYDQPLPASLAIDATPVYSNSGTITSTNTATGVSFADLPSLTAGQEYVLKEVAPAGDLDGQISVYDPSGNLVAFQDTSTDETLQFFTPATGQYSVKITSLGSTGNFTLNVYTGHDAPAGVSTDFNMLVFDTNGNYLPANTLATNNIATNEAIEYGVIVPATGQKQVQILITRANIPAVPTPASHLRYVLNGDGAGGLGPAEYFSYTTPTTGGHNSTATCNGTAAYSVFRPSLPESYTSPGPVTIYFDVNGNRLATPQVRLQPTIAAADAANESFFSSDSSSDPDTTSRNFSGTSAAGPHAAAIAALVLQAHGGSRSVTPAQMTSLLERSTFPHDLDPYYVSGTARASTGGKVTITLSNDSDTNAGTGGNDLNAFTVSYVGSSALTSLVFNPAGTAATAGNVTGGNNGVTYSTTGVGGTVTYFENSFPGMVFTTAASFLVGSASTIPAANVAATLSNLAPAPSTTQDYTLSLAFSGGAFTGGNVLRFNVGRAVQHSSVTSGTAPYTGSTSTNYTADLLGGGVSLPSGTVTTNGLSFSGTTADGGTFSGALKNNIGNGYSVLDGFGFINAQTAVGQTVQ